MTTLHPPSAALASARPRLSAALACPDWRAATVDIVWLCTPAKPTRSAASVLLGQVQQSVVLETADTWGTPNLCDRTVDLRAGLDHNAADEKAPDPVANRLLRFQDPSSGRAAEPVPGPIDGVSTRHAARASITSEARSVACECHRRPALVTYSHSIVPGGLLVTSSTTRLISRTSFVIRVEMRASTS
jgi:hypothetical protein